MKTLFVTALALASAAVVAPALANPSDPAAANAPRSHHAQGMPMTRDALVQRIQNRFAKLDADRDGFVSKAEASAAVEARGAGAHQRMERRANRIFERLDTNNDNVVTRAEAETLLANRRDDGARGDNRKSHNWDSLAARFDSDRNGAISRAEFDSAHAQHTQKTAGRRAGSGMAHRGFGGRLFDRADANNDGRVSLAEATAAATAHFDSADANRDGTLTRDEVRQAHQAMRARNDAR